MVKGICAYCRKEIEFDIDKYVQCPFCGGICEVEKKIHGVILWKIS